MCERSTQKAAFTVIRNFRFRELSLKKLGSLPQKKSFKRTRKLTVNAEELQSERAPQEFEHFSNPEMEHQIVVE